MASSDNDLFVGVVPFVVTAQTLSFKQAAAKLGLTASGVSKAIGRLEAELGMRLLNRSARMVSLTAEGASFLTSCEQAMNEVRGARARAAEQQRAPRGTLVVSLPLILGKRVVLPALKRLLDQYPSLSVRANLTDRFVRLADEDVDVALRIGSSASPGLTLRKLADVRWLTVAAPGYLARHGVPAEPSQLSRHNCLKFMLPRGVAQEWRFAPPAAASVPTHGTLCADHGEALIDAALRGEGLFQAHDYAVADALARGELVEVLAAYRAPGPSISLVFATGKRTAPKVRAFAEHMVQLFAPDPRRARAQG
jgi:DNA-binding transcriptional LysR family regulator